MGKKRGFTIIEVVVAMVLLAMAGMIAAVCVRTAGELRAQEAQYQRADEEMVLQDSEVRKLLEKFEISQAFLTLTDERGNTVGTSRSKGAWGDPNDASGRTMPGVNVPWLPMPNDTALYGETGGKAADVPEALPLTRPLPTDEQPAADETKDVLPSAARDVLSGTPAADVPAVQVISGNTYFVPATGFIANETLPENTVFHAEAAALAPEAGVVSASEQAWAAWLHGGVTLAPGSALTLGEEFLWLEGAITASYNPGETCGQLTLVALSGGDQPTLVYLPEPVTITVTQYVAVAEQQAQGALEGTLDAARGAPAGDAGAEAPLADPVPGEELVPVVSSVTWPAGWYAVPPGTELTALAVAYNGQDAADEDADFAKLLKSWSLDEALLAAEAEKLPTEAERETAQDAARQALDSAWARLVLARVLTQDDLNQTAP